jgi:hypothetical protein
MSFVRARLPRLASALSSALLTLACSGGVDDAVLGAGSQTEQQATGPIFPDDEQMGPGESCQPPVSLVCIAQTSYALEHRVSFLTNTVRTTHFTRPSAAAITSDTTMACHAASDFVVGGIVTRKIKPPANVKITRRADGMGIDFSPRISGSLFDPPIVANPPIQPVEMCNQLCGNVADTSPGCRKANIIDVTAARLSIDGGPFKDVRLDSSLEDYRQDPKTGEVTMTCKLTLPKTRTVVNRKRLNDVLSTNGNRFVRGYELSATSRRGACSSLAGMQCKFSGTGHLDGINDCIEDKRDACVAAFLLPDPCKKGGSGDPR